MSLPYPMSRRKKRPVLPGCLIILRWLFAGVQYLRQK